MHRLYVDIETYSEQDLQKAGVYRYAADPSFKVLLIAYAFDNEPVAIIDLAQKYSIPEKLISALKDTSTIKWAHNANFERVCLSVIFADKGKYLSPVSWRCSIVAAVAQGLPRSLLYLGQWLRLTEQKDTAGTRLINKFSMPCKGKRVMPQDDIEDWGQFKGYCAQDVKTLRAIVAYLEDRPLISQYRYTY